jgi:hypothetical protein
MVVVYSSARLRGGRGTRVYLNSMDSMPNALDEGIPERALTGEFFIHRADPWLTTTTQQGQHVCINLDLHQDDRGRWCVQPTGPEEGWNGQHLGRTADLGSQPSHMSM